MEPGAQAFVCGKLRIEAYLNPIMINFNTVDFSERRSEEVMFLLTLSVVQITNPIRKRIAIRNGFQNVIRSFVNRPKVNQASKNIGESRCYCPVPLSRHNEIHCRAALFNSSGVSTSILTLESNLRE